MNGKTSKALIAIAIGFLTGTALALKLSEVSAWLAWISPFVGGAIGYLSYELRTVQKAFDQAWRGVSVWRITKEGVLSFLGDAGIGVLSFVIFLIIATNIGIVTILTMGIESTITEFTSRPIFWLSLGTLVGGGIFIAAAAIIDKYLSIQAANEYETFLWYSLLRLNPLAVWIYWPVRFFIWGIPQIPNGAKKVKIFSTTFFRFIHSQRRLIIFTWIFLGVSAFLLNIPFWPCFMGSLFGSAISVELIGKRWLKTLPALNGA